MEMYGEVAHGPGNRQGNYGGKRIKVWEEKKDMKFVVNHQGIL